MPLMLILAVAFSLRAYGSGVLIPVVGPLPPTVPDAVSIDALQGESVALQVVISATDSMPRTIMAAGDFAGGNLRISRQNVTLYTQHPIHVASVHPPQGSLPPGPYYERFVREVYPRTFPVPAGGRRLIWYDIQVPETASPGEYVGSLIVQSGGTQRPLFIWLKVHPRRIDDPDIPFVMGFDLNHFLAAHGLERWDQPEGLPILERYLKAAEDHGITLALRGFVPKGWTGQGGESMWSEYDRVLGPYVERSAVWFLPHQPYFRAGLDQPGDEEEISRWFAEVERHWRFKGWDLNRAVAWVYDEPRGRGVAPSTVTRYREIVSHAAPGVKMLLTEAVEDSAYLAGADWVWSTADRFYPPEMAGLKKQGAIGRAGFYQGYSEPAAPIETINAPMGFRIWGPIAWKYRDTVDAMFLWSGNNWHPTNPLEIPDDSPEQYNDGQGTAFWPGPDGPYVSRRIMDIRYGQQFQALLQMAEPAVADSVLGTLLRSALCTQYQGPEPFETGSHYIGPRNDNRWSGGAKNWERDPAAWDRAAKRLRQ